MEKKLTAKQKQDIQVKMVSAINQALSYKAASPDAPIESEIKAAGGLEIDSSVASLVQAMATYSASNAGFNPTSATQAPNDATLQGAVAAAWHH